MRRIEFSRSLEEPPCRVRDELLNRGSGVRVPAPAPTSNSDLTLIARCRLLRMASR